MNNITPLPKNSRARALYDYIPNAGAHEELDMVAGDELVVIDEDDGSGWTKVSRSGSQGLVPTTYIEIISDLDHVDQTQLSDVTEKTKFSGTLAKVLFDYQQQETDELTVSTGQSVWVIAEDDGSGWTLVTNGTEKGHVPSSYISRIEF